MDAHYRVAIFGSARIKEGDQVYRDVFTIARGLAEAGLDVVTGGGPGLMQAANAGHKSANTTTHSIGLNIRLPFEQESNRFLDIKKDFDRFSGRLDAFMSLSDAVIVAPGGVGTILELFYTWQLVQVRHLCETPIILFGEVWETMLGWLRGEVQSRGLFDPGDMRNLFHLTDPVRVVAFINRIQEDRGKMEHVCVNYDRYRVEFR
ncbi:MAG: LOG family protein [Desulfobulbaceae bacterium]